MDIKILAKATAGGTRPDESRSRSCSLTEHVDTKGLGISLHDLDPEMLMAYNPRPNGMSTKRIIGYAIAIIFTAAFFVFTHHGAVLHRLRSATPPVRKASLDFEEPGHPAHFLTSVAPIPCHSENDEKRERPLTSALRAGCISVGVPILAASSRQTPEVLVSDMRSQLRSGRTLQSMYLGPLASILEAHNAERPAGATTPSQAQPTGVFASSPATSLTLLLEFNSQSVDLFPLLLSTLQPLIHRDWLTYWDNTTQSRVERPLTIVASGLADFEHVLRGGNTSPAAPTSTRRYVFFDAPLHALEQPGDRIEESAPLFSGSDSRNVRLALAPATGLSSPASTPDPQQQRATTYQYNRSNSHMASTSYSSAARTDSLRYRDQHSTFAHQIRQAAERGLLSRYWATPDRSSGLQRRVWDTLALEGAGLLSTDDLPALTGLGEGFWTRTKAGVKVRTQGAVKQTELKKRSGDNAPAAAESGKFKRWDTGPGLSRIMQSKKR